LTVILAILVVLAILALFGLFQIAGDIVGLLLMVVMAAIVGFLADMLVPGNSPYGFLGAALAGVVGSWVGVALLGTLGPVLFGIPLISALIGAVIVTAIYALVSRSMTRRV
jgi:uncharacterized membrane protein YeaQ/YmgE (transglycosylase-associated protein family)